MSYGPGTGGYFPPGGESGGYPPPGGGGGYPPPPGGGYGSPGFQPPQQPASQGSAIGALIANVFGLCACWPASLIGVILGIIALTMTSSNPQAAKTCTIIAWVLFGVGVVIAIVMFLFYGAMGFMSVLTEDPSPYTY